MWLLEVIHQAILVRFVCGLRLSETFIQLWSSCGLYYCLVHGVLLDGSLVCKACAATRCPSCESVKCALLSFVDLGLGSKSSALASFECGLPGAETSGCGQCPI